MPQVTSFFINHANWVACAQNPQNGHPVLINHQASLNLPSKMAASRGRIVMSSLQKLRPVFSLSSMQLRKTVALYSSQESTGQSSAENTSTQENSGRGTAFSPDRWETQKHDAHYCRQCCWNDCWNRIVFDFSNIAGNKLHRVTLCEWPATSISYNTERNAAPCVGSCFCCCFLILRFSFRGEKGTALFYNLSSEIWYFLSSSFWKIRMFGGI